MISENFPVTIFLNHFLKIYVLEKIIAFLSQIIFENAQFYIPDSRWIGFR